MAAVVALRSGSISIHFKNRSWNTSSVVCPFLDRGKRPMRSMLTCFHGLLTYVACIWPAVAASFYVLGKGGTYARTSRFPGHLWLMVKSGDATDDFRYLEVFGDWFVVIEADYVCPFLARNTLLPLSRCRDQEVEVVEFVDE